MATHRLIGSDKQPLPGARSIGPADPKERLEVSVVVRRRGSAALADRVERIATGGAVLHLSREDFAQQFGADPADIGRGRGFATSQGLAGVQGGAGRPTSR